MVSELRNLTKPAKIIAVVLAVLFAVSGFLVRDTYYRITGSSSDALAAVARLEKDKLDKVEYQKDCAITQARIGAKVDKETYNTDVQEIKDDVKYLIRLQISKNKASK